MVKFWEAGWYWLLPFMNMAFADLFILRVFADTFSLTLLFPFFRPSWDKFRQEAYRITDSSSSYPIDSTLAEQLYTKFYGTTGIKSNESVFFLLQILKPKPS